VDQAAGIAGASAAVIGLIDRDHIDVVASRGYAPGNIDDWSTFPLDPGTPMTDAIALGDAIFCSNREERDRLWPIFVGRGDSVALGALPLLGRAGVLGALFLGYAEEHEFDAEERSFLQAFASHGALAVERARALAAERQLGLELSFLADASAALASSLDYEETLAQVAALAVPALCDWFACDLLVDGRVELAAVAHVDPEKARWARQLREAQPVDLEVDGGLPAVLRTGRSKLYETVPEEVLAASARSPEELELMREIGFSSVLIVPLVARDQVLGALTLVWAESGRHYGSHDVELAEELAQRVALAIDNARLYRAQLDALASERLARERTERLQRFSTRLAPAMTVDAVAEIAVDKALVASGAATAMLALATADGSQIEVLHIDGRVPEGTLSARVFPLEHRSAVGEVFRTHTPLWFSDRAAWEQYPESVARPDFLKAAAVLPVADAREFFGVLEIAFEREHSFTDDERRFLLAIASQTALALDRARLHEEQHHIAHVLQRSLLPETLPHVPGLEIATTYHAAGANETGGDFYDLFPVEQGHILVIGDVCGHGAEAAALTALCRYTLRAAALRPPDAVPARLLDKLNQSIIRHSPSDEDFASATCLMLQSRGGATNVTLASAGHPPALVRRTDGNVEEHRQNGPITGLFADTIYQERVLRLEPGDLLLLYTDGLMDAKSASGVRVGTETIVDVLADLPAGAGVHEVIAAYERLLEQYEIVDDVAVVAVATIAEHA
jgi:serine phosphatase RsbU (regulator of sigma subunit)